MRGYKLLSDVQSVNSLKIKQINNWVDFKQQQKN